MFAFSSRSILTFIELQSVGSTRESINTDILRNMPIPIPPLPEQLTIASFLDRQTAHLDALISKKERLIALLEEKRAALISSAVTKGLDPNAPMKDSGVEWLGEVPEEWEMKRLKRIFRVVNGSTPKSGVSEYWDGDIAWITPDDLGNLQSDTITETARKITELGYHSCGTTLVPAGSLVLSTRAPIGHLAIAGIDLCTNQGCRALVFMSNDAKRFFYYQLLASRPELESWGQGSTFKELGKSNLEAIELVSPPLPEQRAIASFLDRETVRIDALISKVREGIEKLREYRSALISAAVTGKIDMQEAV